MLGFGFVFLWFKRKCSQEALDCLMRHSQGTLDKNLSFYLYELRVIYLLILDIQEIQIYVAGEMDPSGEID